MKMKVFAMSLGIVLIIGIGFYFIFFDLFFSKKSEFDIPNKENAKIVKMLNIEIDKEVDDHTQTMMHPGYIPESRQNTIDYLKTIKTIESYARYGVKSTRPRNLLELIITFNDGNIAEKVYTGHSCSGFMEPCLLLKVEMKDGKATRIFTNGQEKKGSPDWIVNDLNILINQAISNNISQNPGHYFPPQKTQQDFEKEWENKK